MRKYANIIVTLALWVIVSILANIAGEHVKRLAVRNNWMFVLAIPLGYFAISLISGVGQWVILKKYFRRKGNLFLWIPLTAIGLPVGFAFGYLFLDYVGPLLHNISNGWLFPYDGVHSITVTSIAGAFLGVLQWFIIRRKVIISVLWIPISALAWGIHNMKLHQIYMKPVVEVGTMLGVIAGLISGITITLMLLNTENIWDKKVENEISLKAEV